MRTLAITGAAALMLSLTGAAFAQAPPPPVHHTYYVHHTAYRHACIRHKANNGTVIGAVSGGVLGSLVGGHGVGGTLIGAGAGAVAGHQIAKSNARETC